jgi:hypothetical protein
MAAANNRREQLSAAKQNVESMKNLYPELGGPQWKQRFEELENQINAELEKK